MIFLKRQNNFFRPIKKCPKFIRKFPKLSYWLEKMHLLFLSGILDLKGGLGSEARATQAKKSWIKGWLENYNLASLVILAYFPPQLKFIITLWLMDHFVSLFHKKGSKQAILMLSCCFWTVDLAIFEHLGKIRYFHFQI